MRRRAIGALQSHFGLSQRRCCRLLGQNLSSQRYVATKDPSEEKIRSRIKEIAMKFRRYGAPRIHLILKNEGLVMNHKRTERLYRLEGLQLKRKRPKPKRNVLRVPLERAQHKNHRWSIDFIFDRLHSGRTLKCLTIVDDFTRESPRIEVQHSISGHMLTRIFDEIKTVHGLPKEIRVDNGPEFQSRAFLQYCFTNNIQLRTINPGKPTENSFIESFNGKFRDECLNEQCFMSLNDAKEKIEIWRNYYNEERPHSSLKGLPPEQFAKNQESVLTA